MFETLVLSSKLSISSSNIGYETPKKRSLSKESEELRKLAVSLSVPLT